LLGAKELVLDLSFYLLLISSAFVFVFEFSCSAQEDFAANTAEERLEPRLDEVLHEGENVRPTGDSGVAEVLEHAVDSRVSVGHDTVLFALELGGSFCSDRVSKYFSSHSSASPD